MNYTAVGNDNTLRMKPVSSEQNTGSESLCHFNSDFWMIIDEPLHS